MWSSVRQLFGASNRGSRTSIGSLKLCFHLLCQRVSCARLAIADGDACEAPAASNAEVAGVLGDSARLGKSPQFLPAAVRQVADGPRSVGSQELDVTPDQSIESHLPRVIEAIAYPARNRRVGRIGCCKKCFRRRRVTAMVRYLEKVRPQAASFACYEPGFTSLFDVPSEQHAALPVRQLQHQAFVVEAQPGGPRTRR